MTLELGGNDPAIVLDDVDPKAVAKKIFFASFVNSGQVCMAIKRIYAHEKIYAPLCDALVAEAKKAKVGNGLDPATELGPIQNKMQYDKVVGIIEDTKKRGAKFLTGGDVPKGPGYFLPPTLVTDVPEDSRLVQEEQFGPIVPIMKFSTSTTRSSARTTPAMGSAAPFGRSDVTRGAEIAAKLEVGTAWVNQHRATSAFVPFGGAKESGLGTPIFGAGTQELHGARGRQRREAVVASPQPPKTVGRLLGAACASRQPRRTRSARQAAPGR